MTNNDKSQPTGWVVVDFDDGLATFRDSRTWQPWYGPVIPFASRSDADSYKENLPLRKLCEVHPWPLPASVLARLKAKYPGQDWSQVPVADAPVEKPGRWVMHERYETRDPFRDQDGWRQCAADCDEPWATKDEVEGFIRSGGYDTRFYVPVNLDDLPSPAVAEPSEVERLRAEVEKLTRERDEARASFASICRHSDEQRLELDRLRKSPLLSRLDEFAKAALPGLCTHALTTHSGPTIALMASDIAQATIRALDGAGGA